MSDNSYPLIEEAINMKNDESISKLSSTRNGYTTN